MSSRDGFLNNDVHLQGGKGVSDVDHEAALVDGGMKQAVATTEGRDYVRGEALLDYAKMYAHKGDKKGWFGGLRYQVL